MSKIDKAILITLIVVLIITAYGYVSNNIDDITASISNIQLLSQSKGNNIKENVYIPIEIYNVKILDIINKYRDSNKCTLLELNKQLSEMALKLNIEIYNDVLKGNHNIRFVINESYKYSVFVIKKDSIDIDRLSNENVATLWATDNRECKRLLYPLIYNVGVGVVKYIDCIVCVMIVPNQQINITDMRYWELLPCYYEQKSLIR